MPRHETYEAADLRRFLEAIDRRLGGPARISAIHGASLSISSTASISCGARPSGFAARSGFVRDDAQRLRVPALRAAAGGGAPASTMTSMRRFLARSFPSGRESPKATAARWWA